jgi:hypothetical protein
MALGAGAVTLISHLTDDTGFDFALTSEVSHLSDAATNHLAHDIGVGWAGIYMEDLGYFWRANAAELLPRGSKMPDYVWSTGANNGSVVLSEAKGGAAPNCSLGYVNGRARRGFRKQVGPWLGDQLPTGEAIVSGYGIGIHAPGGGNRAGVVVHEPEFAPPPPQTGKTPHYASAPVLRSHIAAVFRAIDSVALAQAVARDRTETRGSADFAVLAAGDRRFLVGSDRSPPWPDRYPWHGRPLLALEISSAEKLLSGIDGGELFLDRTVETDRLLGTPETNENFSIAADGLAFLTGAIRLLEERLTWSPGRGLRPTGAS